MRDGCAGDRSADSTASASWRRYLASGTASVRTTSTGSSVLYDGRRDALIPSALCTDATERCTRVARSVPRLDLQSPSLDQLGASVDIAAAAETQAVGADAMATTWAPSEGPPWPLFGQPVRDDAGDIAAASAPGGGTRPASALVLDADLATLDPTLVSADMLAIAAHVDHELGMDYTL